MTTTCRDCGVAIDYENALGLAIKPTLCDACYGAFDRSRRTDELRSRLVCCYGIPALFHSWDAKKGNNELLDWVRAKAGGSIWLGGKTGLGKTRAMCRVAAERTWQIDERYRFAVVGEWLRQTCAAMGADGIAAQRRVHELSTVQILILDDLGQEKLSDRATEILGSIIDARYRNGLRVWVSTNLGAGELAARMGDIRGPATERRLREMCEVWHG